MTAIQRTADRQDGLITAEQCRDAGMARRQIDALVRAGLWRAVRRGVYLVDADLRGDPDRRAILRSAALSCGPHAFLTLDSAAELHGLPAMRNQERIHVGLPGYAARPRPLHDRMVVSHQRMVPPSELVVVDGIAVTSVQRTIADLILVLDRLSGVALLDAALFGGLLTAREFDHLPRMIGGRRGAVLARQMLELADARAESPLESRARVRCVDGRVAPDELQADIRGPDGRFIARVDMLWRRHRVVGEADGRSVHDRPGALFKDRERQNALVNAGFRVLRFTWDDTLFVARIPRLVRAALAGQAMPASQPW